MIINSALHHELLSFISKKKKDLELGEFAGDIFWLNNATFSTIALARGVFHISIFHKEDGYLSVFDKGPFHRVALDILKEYLNNPDQLRSAFFQKQKKMQDDTDRLEESKPDNITAFKDFILSMVDFGKTAAYSLEALEGYFQELLFKKISDSTQLDLLITPSYKSYVARHEEALRAITSKLPGHDLNLLHKKERNLAHYSKLQNLLENHLYNWWWAFCDYASQEKPTAQDALNKLLSLKSSDDSKALANKQVEKRRLLSHCSSEVQTLVKFLDLVVELRDTRKASWLRVVVPGKQWLRRFAKHVGIKYEEIRFLTWTEIMRLLNAKKTELVKLRKLANSRRKGCADVMGYKGIASIPCTGKTYKEILSLVTSHSKEECLKGVAAGKGKVIGIVRTVLGKKDFSSFKQGEILIASHITPDYVEVMRKASAILTERGGITSHAAIVSRELEIPCIVGIPGLIGNFKDGETVEVDADKGVVKKISKDEYKSRIKTLEKEEASIEVSRIPSEILKLEIKPDIITWFKDIKKEDILLVGGKGANLGEMFTHFPVPNGFCITVNAYKKFLKENQLEEKIFPPLSKLDIEKTAELDKESKRIQELIINSKIPADVEQEILANYKILRPKFVAVRSSATAEDLPTASFAGQQATILNVKGEQELLKAVKECWASLFTARAIYYRVINKFHHEKVLISVVIQEMVNSAKAGVMFSVHPVTSGRNEIVIEGSFGLGESVVSGSVTPDNYLVQKTPFKIKEINVNEKTSALYRDAKTGKNIKVELDKEKAKSQCLTEKEIKELAEFGIRIEQHYGKPQDIEWAVGDDDKLYILQSRPITTLQAEVDKHVEKFDDYVRLFEATGIPFLINTIALKHYKALQVMAIFRDNVWTTYLPRRVQEKTLTEGVKLFGSKAAFQHYIQDFENYKKRAGKYFNKIVKQKNISKEELGRFFDLCSDFWLYYSKTEFFYVDEAFRQSKKNKTIAKNLKQLEKIKNNSRQFMNNMIFGSSSYLSRVIGMVSKQLRQEINELFFCSKDEILEMYDNKNIDKSMITDRKSAYVFLMRNNLLVVMAGSDANKFISDFLVTNLHSNILRGTIANPGKAKGEITVLRYGHDSFDKVAELVKKMKKGNILVADSTSPEIIVACKKAAAIITNQGGLLSHAAIISRELKIPCIVGTGIATQVLHDGDEVEVDANSGIVKILTTLTRETKSLANKFIELAQGQELYPPVSSMAIFTPRISGYISEGYYKDVTLQPYLTLMKKGEEPFVFTAETKFRNIAQEWFINYWKNRSFLLKEIKKMNKCFKELDKLYSGCTYDFIQKSNFGKLASKADEVIAVNRKLTTLVWFTVYSNQEFYQKLLQECKVNISQERLKEIWIKATQPAFESFEEIRYLQLLDLIRKKKSWLVIAEECQYFFANYNEIKKLDFVKRELHKKYNHISFSEANHLIKKERDRIREITNAHKNFLKGLTPDEKKLVFYLQETMRCRDVRKNSASKALTIVYRIAQKMFKEAGVSDDIIKYYSCDEMPRGIDYIKNNKENIMKRPQGIVMFFITDKDSDIEFEYGTYDETKNKLLRYYDEQLLKNQSYITEIKGQVGCPGKVQGRARIVYQPSTVKDFRKSDIIVTSMTRPEFVPIMRIASAIITDEGGITSHAAIVARELNKPCITGTKIATRVIKDGDYVEVDADKGIVRKLK